MAKITMKTDKRTGITTVTVCNRPVEFKSRSNALRAVWQLKRGT